MAPRTPVTPCKSEAISSALRGHAHPVALLRIPEKGHGFARAENRRAVFGAMVRFLKATV